MFEYGGLLFTLVCFNCCCLVVGLLGYYLLYSSLRVWMLLLLILGLGGFGYDCVGICLFVYFACAFIMVIWLFG